ncbi:hypothetical protein SacxiDRAFT_4120 [Saccharomonospora xinjiangensis XJ-54]|uniref:Uncharacterized protein n=1 Tax=Saccharomonospora xinjiangensis XJ-54 TaxID=882086 RepID=I0V854_9PSEU|nr:hypothetical protein SacxiDRAFT_4120 [Saccharomonospora xinjiangensis XJ-54]
MSELIEFDNLIQVETLLRAGMEIKFEISDDEHILNESPIYASALNRLREGLVSGLRSDCLNGKAQMERYSGLPAKSVEFQCGDDSDDVGKFGESSSVTGGEYFPVLDMGDAPFDCGTQ